MTADNQFATLGVVLLGALAQVNAACTGLLGEVAEPAEVKGHELATAGASIISAIELAGSSGKASNLHTEQNEVLEGPDRRGGAVISRDEVVRAEKLRKKKTKLQGRTQSETFNVPSGSSGDQRHDDVAAPVEKLRNQTSVAKANEADGAVSKEAKPAKKKKKARKGDEFDALFKGLF